MSREVWRDCLGGSYQASSLGRIRRFVSRKLMSLSYDGGGYLKVTVCINGAERTVTVHSLVAQSFIGERPTGYQVNHIDGVKTNNAPSNLEYVTPAQNSGHAAEMGLTASGARHGRSVSPHRTARGERVNTAKLTASDVKRMRRMREAGSTLSELMREFSLSKSATHSVVTRKNWKHVA